MALERYSDLYWFSNGALASSVPARVFPYASNSLAPLYTDATGTVPLPNPINTSPSGVLTFYAESGEYWIHLDTMSFRVSVGAPEVDLGEAATLAVGTGLVSGGNIDVNAGNPKAIDIAPLVGYVVDYYTNPAFPTITRVDRPAQTVALDAAALLRISTWWLIDAAGVVSQQATRPTPTERRNKIVLGGTIYDSGSGSIIIDQSLPTILSDQANQVADLIDAMSPFSVTGNAISANGANLMINKTAGSIFARAFHHFVGPVLTLDPHITDTPAQTPVTFRRVSRTVVIPPPAPVTTVNPTLWDNNGVLTAVVGNDATIQRVFLTPGNNVADQVIVQYGQSVYPNIAQARDALGQTNFIVNPTIVDNGALIAYLIIQGSTTALNNTTQNTIRLAGKFDRP